MMLTIANIRKNKGQTVSLVLFIIIAAALLNVGLVMFFGIGNFFDERAEANHAAHFSAIYLAGAEAIEDGRRFMDNDSRVMEVEEIHMLLSLGGFTIDDVTSTSHFIFSRVDEAQKMDFPSFVGEYKPLAGNDLYLPFSIFTANGFQIGDALKINFSGTELHFIIAGATEEIAFGTTMNGTVRLYVSDEKYREMEKQFPDSQSLLLSARLFNKDDYSEFTADFMKSVSLEGFFTYYNYWFAESARTMVPNIVAIVVTSFSVILLAVSLILIRFRINNNITESMANIGIQKALGYRNRQIISAIVIQFTGAAFIGTLAGIILAQPVIPLIMNILKSVIGLAWKTHFALLPALGTFGFISLLIGVISFASARKINGLHPLIALRGGMATHSFRKNYLPLDQTSGHLSFILAVKHLLHKKGQAAAICLVVAALSMASVAGIAANYNINVKSENFARTFFGEMPDSAFLLKEGENGEAFQKRMSERPDVRKVFVYDTVTYLVNGMGISLHVAEDCSLLEGAMLVDGRYPKHDNEVALGVPVLKAEGKKIGDTVTMKNGEIEKEFIITGTVQQMWNGGFMGLMTKGGVYHLQPDFAALMYYVYLNEDADYKAFSASVEAAEGDVFQGIYHTSDELKATMSSFGGIFSLVALGIVAVTAFVVVLVLYMVIKTTILSRRRELGIQKAVGFTTLQLMNQIALNITPVIAVGVAVGAAVGFFGLNPMMVAFTSSMGIVRAEMPVPVDQAILVCIALVVLAYGVAMGLAWRIRKISAYGLVSE